MRKIILSYGIAILTLMFMGTTSAQEQEDSKSKQKLTKEEKKKQKEAAQLADFDDAKALAESRSLVFQGSEMFTAEGSAPLSARTNFFYVDGDEATLQFVLEGLQYIPNPNGLGGITSKGKVTKYSYKADNPKKPVSIEVTVQPLAGQGIGIHQLVITIYGDEYAELLLQSNGVRVKGSIATLEDSKIYEGTQR